MLLHRSGVRGYLNLNPQPDNRRREWRVLDSQEPSEVHKHLTTHIAHHTFATVSLRNHVPLETISKMLGHSDIKTTQIYAKMVDEAISEDMRKMRDKFDGIEIPISPLPDKPTDFEREPLKKRGRPRKNPV
ncbi:MAG: tyrosine-type recombinase/integrase [Barnesiella sp.]|nr:tyrosine-type recombinase/integrase [Barnesiella sp.]